MRDRKFSFLHNDVPRPRGPASRETIQKICQIQSLSAKLSYADAVTIRQRLAKGATYRLLAAEYGVSRSTIANIQKGIAWKPENYEKIGSESEKQS